MPYKKIRLYLVSPVIALQWCHMSIMVSQITSNYTVFFSKACSSEQRKNQRSTSLSLFGGNPPVTRAFRLQRASECRQSSYACHDTGIILWMRPANERRRYIVTSSFIGWAHSQNNPRWRHFRQSNTNPDFHSSMILSRRRCRQQILAIIASDNRLVAKSASVKRHYLIYLHIYIPDNNHHTDKTLWPR